MQKKKKVFCIKTVFPFSNSPMLSRIFLSVFAEVHIKLINRKSGYFKNLALIEDAASYYLADISAAKSEVSVMEKECQMSAL